MRAIVKVVAHGPSQPEALRHFTAVVVAFAADPGPANLERYLAASRALEASHGRPAVGRRRQGQIGRVRSAAGQ
jgi:hypothetical protein